MKNKNDDNPAIWLSKETGISLRRIALWLQTDQSLLSRWATGTRMIASRPLLRLIETWKVLRAMPEPAIPSAPSPEDAAIFRQMADEWEWKAKETDRQLQYHLQRYRQALRALQWLETLRQSDVPVTPKSERWMEESFYQAEKKLQQHGPAVYKPLETARDMYRMAAALMAAHGMETEGDG
jgi:hypothetical protein